MLSDNKRAGFKALIVDLHPIYRFGVRLVYSRLPQHPPALGGAARRVTSREKELLVRVVDGHSNQRIADDLHLSLSTVKAHLRSLFSKLAVEDRTQAIVASFRRGVLSAHELKVGSRQVG